MAGSVNRVTLVGNLVRDPEVRNAPDGTKIVNVSVATNETWNDKNTGERKERSEFHRVVIFNERTANFAEKFLKKGRMVFVEGALQTRKWTDKEGQDRYSTEIVISRFKGELVSLDSPNDGGSRQAASSAPSWENTKGGDLEDDIQF